MNELHRKARILVIDDDEDDFIITSGCIREIPGNEFAIDWAPTYKEGISRLTADNYDIYFVDYRLGAKSGVDFLRQARDMERQTPIVLLTGQGSRQVDMEAMQLGAVDYLNKAELNTEKMERCIRYALERADTMRALRRSENKFRGIFEKSKDIVFVADQALNFIDVNDALMDLLGFDEVAAGQLSLTSLISSAKERKVITNAVKEGKEIIDHPVVLLTKEGGKLHCTITLSVEHYGGADEYVQGIIHDITNLRKAEQAALQSEKLAAAGRLVRTLAHEVRNPLNNIAMSAEHLQHDMGDEDAPLYLDIIRRNSERINNLITELLQSSIPGDNILRPCDLRDVLDEVLAASHDRLTLKEIGLQTEMGASPVMIKGDRRNLVLALLNIVINAIEAMKEQTGQLFVGVQATDGHAVVKITDNGSGISEDNLGRIFEPFYTRKRSGGGLGLAFTLNIIKAHHATIDVASVLGQGTTFAITFPLVAEGDDGEELI